MGMCFLYGNGGGRSNAYAAISVIYPAGSTCTCTNGTKTLKAKDTSGKYLFLLPEGGTWTVSCTDGSQTATFHATVEQNCAYAITLLYKLYLVNGSDECASITGGLQSGGKATNSNCNVTSPVKTVSSDGITYTITGGGTSGKSYGWYISTINKVDLSNYDTLTFTGSNSSAVYFTIWSSLGTYSKDNVVLQSTSGTLDISGLTGSYYIGFYNEVYGSASMTLTINSMYLS